MLCKLNFLDVYYLLRSLNTVSLLDEELTLKLVEYIVKRGYTGKDFQKLSSKDEGYRRALHYIWIVAHTLPNIKQKSFISHV